VRILDQAPAEHDRGSPDDIRQLAQAADVAIRVADAAGLEHGDVRGRPEQPVTQLVLQAGHQRQRDEECHDPDPDPESRDQRNQ
jgi:hypothetical protein